MSLFKYSGECTVILFLSKSSSYIPLGSTLTDISGMTFFVFAVVLSVSMDIRGFMVLSFCSGEA